jgi:uncharacterized protein YkwD
MPAARRRSPRAPWAALGLAALLGACGGGGGDGGDDAGAAESAAAAAPAASAPVAAASATCGIADFAAVALARINEQRTAGASCGSRGRFAPAPALRWSPLLHQAAAAHSADMAAQNYFSHTSADGRSMSDRVNATGYAWSSLGENIAAGYPDIDAVVTGWMRSDGHCANLMNPAFDELGLACVPGTATSSYRQYWTANLARARAP